MKSFLKINEMSDYIVSALKYRPHRFDEIVEQDNIVRTLKNAIIKGQLAQAYLFSGPRGVGKTTCARIFAKTINCTHLSDEVEACGNCVSCKAFEDNTSFNVHELDAASNNSVDDIRNLIDQVRIPPQIGRYKIYIIDEVHMLSQQAFNAFLKTLEEPPRHAIFILATTEKHKIIPTILSRCQIFDFKRISVTQMANHLKKISDKEQITYEDDGLNIIAQKADGGLRDALSIFDKIVSFSGGQITYHAVLENLNVLDYDYYFLLIDAFHHNDYATAITMFDEILDKGFNEANFINGLAIHFRDLLMLKNPGTLKLLEVGENIAKKYEIQAGQVDVDFILSCIKILNKYMVELKSSLNKRLHIELALIELSTLNNDNRAQKSTIASKKPIELEQNPKSEQPEKKIIINKETSKEEAKKDDTVKPSYIEKEDNKQDVVQEKKGKPLKSETKPSSIIPDLGNMLQMDDDEKTNEIDTEEQLNEAFTDNDLKEKWRLYQHKFLEDDARLMYLFDNYIPQIKEFPNIELELVNDSQLTEIKSIYTELTDFLKAELKNMNLKLEIIINKDSNKEEDIPYIDEDKYQYLKKKNPKIDDLRDQLNLFFE